MNDSITLYGVLKPFSNNVFHWFSNVLQEDEKQRHKKRDYNPHHHTSGWTTSSPLITLLISFNATLAWSQCEPTNYGYQSMLSL
jgi:hypothetical protein